ncbi:GNAT family N-acetyltransferase [Chamaesiphon minutus]|uniref:Acetyltransferase n=1 Tax=Chamaesiphon minutus (strain ATCC 27169 / PCC 6605) TaxID=1173020 RepID=K9URF0_CHAP6|nr:GNAT family N-acetyltransferase [Chamaesiphon minutus]AFY97041.1 acetyltransferase [Chamaesiphon minutus PCC 6605]
MIRSIAPDDTAALIALAKAAIPFEPNEIEELSDLLTRHFDDAVNSHDFWLTDDDNGLVSVVYVAPERMTQGTWNLYLIAVHPDRQQQGRGTAILAHVEQMLAKRGERLLLVETAGTEDFEYVRAFYRHQGYVEEARIRDFYADSVDKIVFRKQLSADG